MSSTNINKKLNDHFGGKVVRKDLTTLIKGNAIVPTYVLEYLLGQYCATDDEDTIEHGLETIKSILSKHFVYRDEAQLIKSTVREKGSHRIIDKVSVKLNDKKDQYEASFSNLGLHKVPISDEIIKTHRKLLSSGVWCILTLAYLATDENNSTPWMIESLKPIQISNVDIDEFKEVRKEFSKEEWVDALMQSIGLNPKEFSFRSKLIQLTRLVPFTENNYNLIELGPKGTGKSHIYSELSPHGILISGGEVSKAKLFVNNSNGEIGLVGYWDVVAYDEFAGKTKRADKGLVDIMKNYMANRSFSRGTEVYGASASMVFVGNTDHSVQYMVKHSDLFEALPKEYYDTAFLDRIHAYIPGWEVQKLRNEMFTKDYGFIVDYLAEILKGLRKEDRTNDYAKYFDLSSSITTRDKTSIAKTYSGLIKIIYPDDKYSQKEAKEILDFAIESRKRVKLQLQKMDETFEEVDFSYTLRSDETKKVVVETLERIEYDSPENIHFDTDISINVIAQKLRQEAPKKAAIEGEVSIRDNQVGIDYKHLFEAYLKGACSIKIVDPYIRLPYQMRNFMEFIKLILEIKGEEEVSVHLVTNNNEDYIANVKEAFGEISESAIHLGINFTYEFDEAIDDRFILLDNGWKIVLSKGLDIFQKTRGWYDLAEYTQGLRLCKACEINYIRE